MCVVTKPQAQQKLKDQQVRQRLKKPLVEEKDELETHPFAIGGVLALFALYLRRGIDETDAFRETNAIRQNRGSITELLAHLGQPVAAPNQG
jgi:hypothetical protein